MPTSRSTDSVTTQKPPRPTTPLEDLNAEIADEVQNAAEESDELQELSFDDDSRSDRHRAIGSEQSAQSDNAPDENVDELDEGNDIGEQDER